MYIRYQDTYRRDADGAWKIATRKVMADWTECAPRWIGD